MRPRLRRIWQRLISRNERARVRLRAQIGGSNLRATLLLGIFLTACSGPDFSAPRVIAGSTMGTSYMLSLGCGLDLEVAREAAEAAFARVDHSMSGYRPDSELMTFNRSSIGQWLTISQDFAAVVQSALDLGVLSEGAFDPTVGALVELWGFGATEGSGSVPDASEIGRLLEQTGLRQLELDSSTPAIRRLADFSLDLSAIAKGYAVDLAAATLQESACQDFLVEVGGEVGVRGVRPDGSPWRIGVESPSGLQAVTHRLTLRDEAIATSGDYRNFLRIEGELYSHTIDPQTGFPVLHELTSVSVIADTAMRADALATALNVMGPEDGLAFALRHDLEALFIIRTENGYDSFGTGRFDDV